MYASRLGAWYDSLSDLESDVSSLVGGARSATNAASVLSNNVSNLTSPRINISTLLYGAVGVGVVYYVVKQQKHKRRSNPRGRRRLR